MFRLKDHHSVKPSLRGKAVAIVECKMQLLEDAGKYKKGIEFSTFESQIEEVPDEEV